MTTPHSYPDHIDTLLATHVVGVGPLPSTIVAQRQDRREDFPGISIDLEALLELQRVTLEVRSSTLERASDDDAKAAMDAWLAPRLHACLRVPRRLAADRGFWAWLDIEHLAPYVEERFQPREGERVATWRYAGTYLRNGVSRLWWGADMVRNGPSYEYVGFVFRRVRTAQFALELSYSQHRAAAIAFTRVAEGLDGGGQLSDARMQGLSKRINVELAVRSLEALAEVHGFDDDPPATWFATTPSIDDLLADELPVGPPTEPVPDDLIRSLESWFRSLVPSA